MTGKYNPLNNPSLNKLFRLEIYNPLYDLSLKATFLPVL